MKKIKWIAIILFIIIMILSAIIILLPKKPRSNNSSYENNNAVEEDKLETAEELGIVAPDEINEELDYNEFCTILNCINQYLDANNSSNSVYIIRDEEGDYTSEIDKEELNRRVQSLISTNYNGNVEIFENKNAFIPIEMLLKTQGSVVQSYIAYGVLSNIDMEYQKDAYYIVNLDTVNQTFSIEELDESNINIREIKVAELKEIEKNEYNNYKNQKVNNEDKYKLIFNNIKRLMLTKSEIAYEYLDDDYKAKRFGSYEKFRQYIENNREHLIGITPKKYEVEDDGTKLLLADQYGVWYEFNITSPMKYTAKIDNHIIMLDSDVKDYKDYSEEAKVKYNVNRWIKMINSKDYEIAYKYLDETFKEENYPTEEQFTRFIQEKYTDWYNNVEINVQQDGNTYTAKVELNVDGEEFTDKYMTIYMKLDKDTDFTMSFDAE